MDKLQVGYFIGLVGLPLVFFYQDSLVWRMIAILIFAIQIPGSIIMTLVLKKTDISTHLLGFGIGIINLGIWGYIVGLFNIHYYYSLIISSGIPYGCLVWIFMRGRQ